MYATRPCNATHTWRAFADQKAGVCVHCALPHSILGIAHLACCNEAGVGAAKVYAAKRGYNHMCGDVRDIGAPPVFKFHVEGVKSTLFARGDALFIRNPNEGRGPW